MDKKEKLPSTFVTSMISDGWERVGMIQDNIAAIGETFSDTEEVAGILQDLLDSYLVCIGRLQAHLQDSDLLASEVNVTEVVNDAKEAAPPEEIKAEEPVEEVTIEEPAVAEVVDIPVEADAAVIEADDKKATPFDEPFEFFCDFDECPIEDEEADEKVRADLQTRFGK